MSPVLAEQLVSELVYVHVGMAIISYATFTVSFIFSIMYLLQYRLLKRKMECEIKKVRKFTEARIDVLRIKFIFCSIFLTSYFIRMHMGIYKIGQFPLV